MTTRSIDVPGFTSYLQGFRERVPDYTFSVAPPTHDPDAVEMVRVAPEHLVDLDGLAWGNTDQIRAAMRNASIVQLLRDLDREAHRMGTVRDEPNAAAAATVLAGQMIDAAYLLYCRENRAYSHAALAVLRSALELVARAAHVILGRISAADYTDGVRSKDRKTREAAIAKMPLRASCRSLDELLAPSLARPREVERFYQWLCSHAHLDLGGVEQRPAHREVYAALAFAALLVASVVEVVAGIGELVLEPPMPSPLPWDSEQLRPELRAIDSARAKKPARGSSR